MQVTAQPSHSSPSPLLQLTQCLAVETFVMSQKSPMVENLAGGLLVILSLPLLLKLPELYTRWKQGRGQPPQSPPPVQLAQALVELLMLLPHMCWAGTTDTLSGLALGIVVTPPLLLHAA